MSKIQSDQFFIILLVVLCGFLFYFNSHIPFIYDDIDQIVNNSNLHSIFNISDILSDRLRPSRIIQNLSIALNWSISGDRPWSYHLFNDLLHLVNTLLFFHLIPFIGIKDNFVKYVSCLIFFIHPIQVESVSYIMGRPELLKTFFTLVPLCLYMKTDRPKVLIFILLSLGLLAKETCVLTPLLFIALDMTALEINFKELNIKEHLFYLSHALFLIPFKYLVNFSAYKGLVGFDLFPFKEYVISSFHHLVFYMNLFLNPVEQSIYHDWLLHPPMYSVVLGVLIYVCMVFVGFKKFKTQPSVSFVIFFFLISFLPNNSILQYSNPFAEYRLYQSNFALALFTACLVSMLQGKLIFKFSFTIILLVYFGGFHYLYLTRWHDPLALWDFALSKYPESSAINLNIGDNFYRKRICKPAIAHMKNGCTGKQYMFFKQTCARNLGHVYLAMNMPEKSFPFLEALLRDPQYRKDELFYRNLLMVIHDINRLDLRPAILKQAREAYPDYFKTFEVSKLPNKTGKKRSSFCLDL